MGTIMRDISKGKGPAGSGPLETGRRIAFHHLDSTTIPFFFTNFPEEAKTSDLRKLFAGFGLVEEVFVPKKLDKWGKKFRFVKFKGVEDEEELAECLQEVWLWNSRLKVNRARFQREEQKKKVEVLRPVKVVKGGGAPLAPGVTYKDAAVIPCMEVQPSVELLDSLKWGFVGELHNFMDATEVRQRLVMEGVHRVKVTGMGDRMMLLHIHGAVDIESVIINHKQWWNLMFKKVVKWSPQLVVDSRTVWVKVFGIPLHVWEETLFKKLGSLFGVFVDFDEDTISRKRLN
jgi:hypothetical protein